MLMLQALDQLPKPIFLKRKNEQAIKLLRRGHIMLTWGCFRRANLEMSHFTGILSVLQHVEKGLVKIA